MYLTLLHLAAQTGHKDIVAALIKLGAEIEVPNAAKQQALELAKQAGHQATLEVLKQAIDYKSQGVLALLQARKLQQQLIQLQAENS